ncbi:hypothetical protein ACTG2M_10590 [Aeromonas veronii]|uniref:hypothetical protein n=1 Tax=Aeromonas veronii TaxID=654 RepID=UPI0038F3E624
MERQKIITEDCIGKGLETGVFKKDGTVVRNVQNGQIVKIIKEVDVDRTIIPPTLIQVNNNVVYQADISRIISAIIETKNSQYFDDLDEKYRIVIDSLEYYQTHAQRLDSLNKTTLESSSVFEIRILNYLDNVDPKKFDYEIDHNKILNALSSYINILFIYLLSTFWLHNDRLSSDGIILRKIESLESKIQVLYEQLLAKSYEEAGKNIITLNDSLYAMYLLDKSYDISHVESLVKYDRRFKSVIDFFGFMKRFHLKENKKYDDWGSQIDKVYEVNINISGGVSKEKNNKYSLVIGLHNVLEKLQALKNIREEIIESGKLKDKKFDFYDVEGANKALHGTAMLLSLHSGQ